LSDYEGFSKQDLYDRRNALLAEWNDLRERKKKVSEEMGLISELLEDMK